MADLPFAERPLDELLALDRGGDPDYAGYGWARAPVLWLGSRTRPLRRVHDALVVAAHASDDGPPLSDDIELTFELPAATGADVSAAHVRVHASTFLAHWLPRLPAARAVVLAICNPHAPVLPRAPGLAVPMHYALGDVYAYEERGSARDPALRVCLRADRWRTLWPVSTELERRPECVITEDQKQTYAGLYVLKKMDLKPEDGGMVFPAVLPSELQPIDEVLQQLAVHDYVVINAKKERWDLTKKGIAYLGEHIDEAEDLLDEFEDAEVDEMLAELEARNLDPFRARFLWAWYDGEIDDLVLYQERRGVKPVERMWAFYLMDDAFWNDLAREIEGD